MVEVDETVVLETHSTDQRKGDHAVTRKKKGGKRTRRGRGEREIEIEIEREREREREVTWSKGLIVHAGHRAHFLRPFCQDRALVPKCRCKNNQIGVEYTIVVLSKK